MNLERQAVVLITGGRRVGARLARDARRARGQRRDDLPHQPRGDRADRSPRSRPAAAEALAVEADLSDAEQAERAVAEVGRAVRPARRPGEHGQRLPADPVRVADPGRLRRDDRRQPGRPLPRGRRRRPGDARASSRPTGTGLKGKIVNVGDWATERPYRDYLPYIVAKGGLTTMTLALAGELAPASLVNLVQPAMIDPPPDLTDAERCGDRRGHARCGGIGTPADANRLILYLLEGTDFATGACFRVDGGRFLGADDEGT